jgi:hypothetical protein
MLSREEICWHSTFHFFNVHHEVWTLLANLCLIARMRGYSKHIQNKSYLMTTGWNWYHFPRHVDWDMEHEEAWDNLKK